MSRIGRDPIPVPPGVEVTLGPRFVRVSGPKGNLERRLPDRIRVSQEADQIVVTRSSDAGEDRALHGLTRTLVANLVKGVTEEFSKNLEIHGVGYRAALKGRDLELSLGYSHPVPYPAPDGITFEVPSPTRITVRGADKELVGQVAAEIRAKRKPEPYKLKGIRYAGEQIRKKSGKTSK
ncbi:MAG: 50S ribosomal protein L6 [Actinomycetota bacterium]|nr:50S ribosomal protein L6 [Actinomycetota bacterium]